jgi:5'-phosphate synthase pdxT subunit
MNIVIARNAFGRQVDSFEVDLNIPALINSSGENPPYHAVFIRAPLIESIGPGVESLAKLENGKIVAARQGNLLATSFHPELTRDARFHQYFLEMAK